MLDNSNICITLVLASAAFSFPMAFAHLVILHCILDISNIMSLSIL